MIDVDKFVFLSYSLWFVEFLGSSRQAKFSRFFESEPFRFKQKYRFVFEVFVNIAVTTYERSKAMSVTHVVF